MLPGASLGSMVVECSVYILIILKVLYDILPHNVASESEITPCNTIDKPIVVYRFSGNAMTSIITLRETRETLDVFTTKMQFLSIFNVM